jgi:thioredoxin reductase (NADPH)
MELNLTGLSGQQPDAGANDEEVKILVIGSGPAGLAAALYAARAEMKPVVLSGMSLHGQAALTHTIENYPGFPDGVGGSELGELFQKQAERFGTRIEFDTASEVDLKQRPFTIKTYGKRYLADSLIIASGATPNHLQVPNEERFTGLGVSYCATCDGWFFKDKKVVVVGGGDSALEEGIFLTRYAASVTIIHRRDALRAGAILQKRANENPKINFIWNTVVTEVLGEGKVQGVRLKNVQTGAISTFATDGLFIFIGHKPNSELFVGQVETDALGYIKTDMLMQTSVPGVYAAGEIADPHYRQVVTSAGMGAAAAIQAVRFLQDNSS